jgi:multiple sugar transport system substrate-binding protein
MSRLRLLSLLGISAFALGIAVAPASAKTQLHVIVAHFSDHTLTTFQDAAKRFEATHPDVEINVEDVSWDNLQQRLATDIAGGTAPDISVIATRWVLDYVQNDIAEPLDGYITPQFRGRFYENLLTPGTVNGKTYLLPILASTRALYYNKDLYEKAGVTSIPKTWDELRAASEKVKAMGGGAYGFGIQGKEIETDTYWYYPFWSYGGEIVQNGKSGIASEAGVKAADLYKSFIDQGLSEPSPTGSNRQDIETLFKQGRLGALVTGPWLRGQIASEAPKLNYGMVPMPAGTKALTWGGTDSIMLFKSSPNKEMAWKFIEEGIFSKETRLEFTLSEGFLPVLKEEMDDPRLAGDKSLKVFADMLPIARFAPLIPQWEQVVAATISALQQIYLGQADAKTALGAAASQIDTLIAPQ